MLLFKNSKTPLDTFTKIVREYSKLIRILRNTRDVGFKTAQQLFKGRLQTLLHFPPLHDFHFKRNT